MTYTLYEDAINETITYPGWHEVGTGVYETTGPVQVSRNDRPATTRSR